MLGRAHVQPSVPALLHEIQIEGAFPDGVFLVTVHDPIASFSGDLSLALYGSFLPIPSASTFPLFEEPLPREDVPGAVVVRGGPIKINVGRDRVRVKVTNTGDRPIQVGSHYHFTETNKALLFDRSLSLFRRLDIAAGTAVRFEPGDTKTVTLVDIAGEQVVSGGNCLVNTTARRLTSVQDRAMLVQSMVQQGFGHAEQPGAIVGAGVKGFEVGRESYASMYGPTTGDRVRLADMDLWVEVERDLTVYGDELKFGGGTSPAHSASHNLTRRRQGH